MSSANHQFLLLKPEKRQREASLGSDDLIAQHGLLKIQEHSVALRPGNYLQQVPGNKAFYRKGTSFDLAPLAGLNPIGLDIKPFAPQQLATFRFARVKTELEQEARGDLIDTSGLSAVAGVQGGPPRSASSQQQQASKKAKKEKKAKREKKDKRKASEEPSESGQAKRQRSQPPAG